MSATNAILNAQAIAQPALLELAKVAKLATGSITPQISALLIVGTIKSCPMKNVTMEIC